MTAQTNVVVFFGTPMPKVVAHVKTLQADSGMELWPMTEEVTEPIDITAILRKIGGAEVQVIIYPETSYLDSRSLRITLAELCGLYPEAELYIIGSSGRLQRQNAPIVPSATTIPTVMVS